MTAKKILILGSTGPTGLLVIQKALDHGHIVTLYVRNPAKLPEQVKAHKDVKVIHGQLSDTELLSSSVEGQDVIISVLGPNSLSLAPDTFAGAYRVVFNAMRKYGVKRIFGLGTISIKDPKDSSSFYTSLMVNLVWAVAHSAWKEIIAVGKTFDDEADGLDWTVYRVGGLANGDNEDVTAAYVGAENYSSNVHRKGIAKWLIDQAEKQEPEWLHQKPVLCTSGINVWDIRP